MKKKLLLTFVAMFALTCNSAWAQSEIFKETFDKCEGTGGNDNAFSGSIASGTLTADNEGWTFTNGYGADKCAKFGAGSKLGSAETPALTSLNGDATLTFRAAAWKGDQAELNLSVSGGGTLDKSTVTLTNEAWGEYTIQISNGTAATKIKFEGKQASKARFFLDDIVITTASGTSKKSAGLEFNQTSYSLEQGETFTAPTFTKATTAAVTFTSDNMDVATVSADGVIALGTELGTAVITATSEANDEYEAGTAICTIDVAEYNHYVKATTVESGKAYLLGAVLSDGTAFYAYPLGTSKNYGYLSGSTSKSADDVRVKKSYDDTFVFTSEADGWTIKQNTDSRYLYQTGTYNNFNVAAEPTDGQYWTISANEDGTQTITNKSVSKYIQYSPSYTSFGSYAETQENAILPTLYVLKTATNINGVVGNNVQKNDAIYNLAGQRVSKSYKGVVVKNGKKYVQK